MSIDLGLPVNDILITQGFGYNYLDFYKQWGLKGHPGIDFKAKGGCNVMAMHEGIISWCGLGKDGGIGIEIWNKEDNYKTFYYHHLENLPKIQKGIKVLKGDSIAKADNTGKYTTGNHEHVEFYFVDSQGNTLNKNNGYGGSVDFSEYLPKDFSKSRAYHYYGRKRNLLSEFNVRFKNPWLHRQLNKRNMIYKIYDNEFINALTYGGWDFDTIMNDSMYENWGWLKKDEYKNGMKSFM